MKYLYIILTSQILLLICHGEVFLDHIEGTWIEEKCFRLNIKEILTKFGIIGSVEDNFPLSAMSVQKVTKSEDFIEIQGQDPTGMQFRRKYLFHSVLNDEGSFKPFFEDVEYNTSSKMLELLDTIMGSNPDLIVKRNIHNEMGCMLLQLSYIHVPSGVTGYFFFAKQGSRCSVPCNHKFLLSL